MTDPEEFEAEALYREAYGLARRLLELERWNLSPGAHQRGRGRGGGPGLVVEVTRQLGRSADDPTAREAVEDAVEGRRPRW